MRKRDMVDYMQAKIYSEVYEILEILGQDYINKIPKKLYSLISDNRDKNYIPKYNKETPIYEQKLEKKTVAFLCMLHYNYWCESEMERRQINKILNYNQKLKIKEYDKYKQKFKKNKIKDKKENNQLIQVKAGIIEKIKKHLKSFIRKVNFYD